MCPSSTNRRNQHLELASPATGRRRANRALGHGAAAAHHFQRDRLRPTVLVASRDPFFEQVKTTAYVTGQFMPAALPARGLRISPQRSPGKTYKVLRQTKVLVQNGLLSLYLRSMSQFGAGISRHGHIVV
jgi:hypothetical protein